eukprot:TRINITY_DN11373_c0_g1_i1.p1 TRINITY_DN11373_c0_g1~~TRINITY_DN11373_c0_g1_i1.p1  ORF type:complete len:195 (-),score=55.59 TRINITY_DN11373_c0_g1_i1:70-654(-)
MRNLLFFIVFFSSFTFGSATVPKNAEIIDISNSFLANNNSIFLIRHGEKPEDDEIVGLNERGKKRAQCLRKVFGASSLYKIGKIMAMTPKPNGKQSRPLLTVQPLAADLNITVDIKCQKEDLDCVKDSVDKWNKSNQGKNILLCWEHKMLNNIAKALGVKKAQNYPSDHYDLIWKLWNNDIVSVTSEKCPGLDV